MGTCALIRMNTVSFTVSLNCIHVLIYFQVKYQQYGHESMDIEVF